MRRVFSVGTEGGEAEVKPAKGGFDVNFERQKQMLLGGSGVFVYLASRSTRAE